MGPETEAKTAPWPLDAWYVACTPEEIADKPLGRRICGEAMVFHRGKDGRAVALEDFCPHRGAPLSLGFVRDGELVCGYHGLVMGCEGRATSMPGQRVAAFPAIRAFPVLERHGFVWVWPGDPAQADPAKLHPLFWADSPDWAYGGGLYHIACDYRLMVDNLMDLTHETYVHATSIGQKEIDEAPVTTRLDGEEVVTSRFMEGIQAPAVLAHGPARRGPARGRDRRPLADLPLLPAQPRDDRGRRRPGRPWRLSRPGRQEGIAASWWTSSTPETETSHPVLLGHGAQLRRG